MILNVLAIKLLSLLWNTMASNFDDLAFKFTTKFTEGITGKDNIHDIISCYPHSSLLYKQKPKTKTERTFQIEMPGENCFHWEAVVYFQILHKSC